MNVIDENGIIADQSQTPQADGSNLLEHYHNTVTTPGNEHGARFEVAKCGCRCWFCPDCCESMGYNLRARLIPVLETFNGLIMVSLTIDPELFPDPKTAYLYTMDHRCISVTVQDLHRGKCLYTRRYFYVVEWQVKTEMAHFHVLFDSSYVEWAKLLLSWSKHRPKEAGPVIGGRPAFGTVIFSVLKFDNPAHAGRYATKYLIKAPEHGFPGWVLAMGADRRIRRYSTSRGFWGNPSKLKTEPQTTRIIEQKSYTDKIARCGDSVNVFEAVNTIDPQTGEISKALDWVGRLNAPAQSVMDNLFDPGNPDRSRRSLLAEDIKEVKRIIQTASGTDCQWTHYRKIKTGTSLN